MFHSRSDSLGVDMGTCASHEVVSDRDLVPAVPGALAPALEAMMSSKKGSQANLSQLRRELRELVKWTEITRKCALNGKPIHVREAVCAKLRFDEKKAQIDAHTSQRPNHCGVDRVRDG